MSRLSSAIWTINVLMLAGSHRGLRERQPLDHLLHQLALWQEAVPILGSLLEHVHNSRLVAKVGIGSDAEFACDRIGGHEADAEDIGGELVGVLRDDLDGLVAVLLVDLHRVGG